MAEFFNMGGYAYYIWLSFGITAVVMIANVIVPKLREKQIRRELTMKIERGQL